MMEAWTVDRLIKEWTEDSPINSTEPGQEITKIPKLHAKYVAQISAHSMALKMINIEFYKLKKIKVNYYSGRLSQEELKELGWEPFRFTLKSDLQIYLDADKDLNKLVAARILHEEAKDFCVMVVKELSNRTWQLKEFIGWEKFIAGQ